MANKLQGGPKAPEDDLLALAQPSKVVEQEEQPAAFSAGHNIGVDLRNPDRIVLVIRRGWEGGNMLEVKPGKKSKSGKSTFYLCRTSGAMYGSRAITVDGKACWLKVEISLRKEDDEAA